MKYNRVLVKLSGEALKGRTCPFDPDKLDYVTDQLIELFQTGVEIAVVIGGGNISRGTLGKRWNISPVDSDINGMWATIINAGWISSVLESKIGEAYVRKMLSIPASYCGEMYSPAKAKSYFKSKKMVVIGGGNGISLCTTDSAAVQRAIELRADCVIMLKNGVDGIYTEDPRKNPDAKRYETMSFTDLERSGSKIIDRKAAIDAAEYKMPMHFINFDEPAALVRVCSGEKVGTYVGDVSTKMY